MALSEPRGLRRISYDPTMNASFASCSTCFVLVERKRNHPTGSKYDETASETNPQLYLTLSENKTMKDVFLLPVVAQVLCKVNMSQRPTQIFLFARDGQSSVEYLRSVSVPSNSSIRDLSRSETWGSYSSRKNGENGSASFCTLPSLVFEIQR